MISDNEEDFELDDDPEDMPVCPDCGSDDVTFVCETDDGENEYVCEECGKTFVEGEEDV